MKKLLSIVVLSFLFFNISLSLHAKELGSKSSGFISSDLKGKAFKLTKGYNIENPENKILLIWNHGGNETKEKFCNQSEDLTFISMLSGAKIGDKEVVVWMNCLITNTRHLDATGGREAGRKFKASAKKCIKKGFGHTLKCPYWQEYLRNLSTDVRMSVTEEVVNSRTISRALIPFVRPRNVTFTGSGFQPNTRVYGFFDGVAVTQFITPSSGFSSDSTIVAGSPLITSSSGAISDQQVFE